jgi:drug/metabolite transporter (DMT)-like permease
VIIAPGEKVFGALLAIAGAVIVLTGHWATTDDMIADLIAGLLMLAFGVIGQAVFPKYPRSGQRLGPMTIATFSSFWVIHRRGRRQGP